MKLSLIFACAAASVALTACNKSADQGNAPAANDTVKITTANPPPGGTWSDVVNATDAGFMMGNPNAKVKLIEIGSLSCPHCKVFDDEGVPPLIEKYVKSGNVSWEFRPYVIHGAIDMASNLMLRCADLKSFFPLSQALYKDQDSIMAKIQAAPAAEVSRIQDLPPNQAFIGMANLMGLQDWAAARGLPQAKSNQCLSNEAMINHEVQLVSDVTEQYPEFPGTPTFIINGTMLKDTASWAKLKPQLDEALK
ncbi:MAG TPA: thioredoxin domain-containing protein [Sphingomicrobium sp.]|nr:thioredoxin domain-containing protein [Sphingomicrobium sp.]